MTPSSATLIPFVVARRWSVPGLLVCCLEILVADEAHAQLNDTQLSDTQLSHANVIPAQVRDPEAGSPPSQQLPPVSLEPYSPAVPQPSVDAGLLMGVCGVGSTRVWQTTRFCLGAISDVFWGRAKDDDFAAGFFGTITTSGFTDLRVAAGASAVFPLIDWLSGTVRVGPLFYFDSGPAAGVHSALELGQRAISHSSRYSLSHAVVISFDASFRTPHQEAQSALMLGFRIDGLWLAAPLTLFR